MNKNLLVYIEHANEKVLPVSIDIVKYSACNFNNMTINAIVLCAEQQNNTIISQLENSGLDNLYILNNPEFNSYSTLNYTEAISDFIKTNAQDIFLMGATSNGRDLAPRIASRNELGLTADCTEIGIDDECRLLATRPTYGGQLMATILSKTVPNFATIRPNSLKTDNCINDKKPNIILRNYSLQTDYSSLLKIINVIKKQNDEDWTVSDIIVAGGKGLKTKENFDLIYNLADLLGAKAAASRCAVELGWAEQNIQVGQTGSNVAPKLYIAFGISGAMQHLCGINNADKIIAVNTDKDAPIMQMCDIAIQSDAVACIKSMIDKLSD